MIKAYHLITPGIIICALLLSLTSICEASQEERFADPITLKVVDHLPITTLIPVSCNDVKCNRSFQYMNKPSHGSIHIDINKGLLTYFSNRNKTFSGIDIVRFKVISHQKKLTHSPAVVHSYIFIVESPTKRRKGNLVIIGASNSNSYAPADYKCSGSADDKIIQKALDEAACNGGGTVLLLDGEYHLNASLLLPSNICLSGSSHNTVLSPSDEIVTNLTAAASRGDTTINVTESKPFKPGMGLIINDSLGGIKVKIKDISNDRSIIILERPLFRDFSIGSPVIHAFPIIDVNGHPDYGNVRHSGIIVKNLKINGKKDKVKGHTWLHSAVTFWNAEHCVIRHVWVDNSSFDGISDQGFDKESQNHIVNNLVTNSRGVGLHIGTGYSYNIIENNTISNSGSYGIYFCLRVRNNLLLNNLITNSGTIGIGGIDCCYNNDENFGDYFNLLIGNTIAYSGKQGICIEGAKYNIFYQNKILNNGDCGVYLYNGMNNCLSQNAIINHRCSVSDRIVDVPYGNHYSANNILLQQ